jgi:hypothetical protein
LDGHVNENDLAKQRLSFLPGVPWQRKAANRGLPHHPAWLAVAACAAVSGAIGTPFFAPDGLKHFDQPFGPSAQGVGVNVPPIKWQQSGAKYDATILDAPVDGLQEVWAFQHHGEV